MKVKQGSNGKYEMKQGQFLEVVATTWSKDSYGLFDYECDKVTQRMFRLEQSCKVFRNERSSDIEVVSLADAKKGKLPAESYFLHSVHVERFPGLIEPVFSMSAPENNTVVRVGEENFGDAYLVVRSLKGKDGVQKGLGLGLGDILKLGKMEFQVLEYRD